MGSISLILSTLLPRPAGPARHPQLLAIVSCSQGGAEPPGGVMNDVLLLLLLLVLSPLPQPLTSPPKKVEREQHASMQITQSKQPIQCQFDRNSKNAQEVSRR